jgi:hypothetical protein
MNQDNLLFYDIEVFKHTSLVVFKDIDKKTVKIFHNRNGDASAWVGLDEFIKGKILVGYNNYHYDDLILTYMIQRKPQHLIKQLNDKIIGGEGVNYVKPTFESLDCYQQIDVSRPSLKRIEGNMGIAILESKVAFDLDRQLTDDEFFDVLHYCSYDVDSTIDIYKKRQKSYFMPKDSLLEMLGKPNAKRWNTTTISANLLLETPLPKWAAIRLPNASLWDYVPDEVREMWVTKAKDYITKGGILTKSITIEAFGCDVQFGFGGLHGAHKTIKKSKKVKLLDVRSMYPEIILLLGVLGMASEKYRSILLKRIQVKHKDETLSDALKLILNSVFGNLNNRYSLLYNPCAALSVCVYGQIALFALCKYMEPFVEIININTDGIAFIPHDSQYIQAYQAWQDEFQLFLEEKVFDILVQKDVNNYIAVQGEKYICKGGDVSRYEKDALFKNNNARILDIALCESLVHGRDYFDVIYENQDKPHLFQYILNTSSKYLGTFDEAGQRYNKVNRVFASREEGFCLYKKRFDGGLVKYADAPQHMFLHNEDCKEIDDFEGKIDLKHYYNIVKKRMERWI